MFVSEITLEDIIKNIEAFCPVKVSFNGVVIYNDYDSDIVVDEFDGNKVYGELYPLSKVAPSRIEEFKDYVVTYVNIQITDYHHSIIDIYGKSVNETNENMELKFSELLSYVTGGRLSNINYDIRYMKEVADDYQRDMCANGCDELECLMSKLEYVERERDAAIGDLTGDCSVCKHSTYCSLHPCFCINGNVWAWRGIPEKKNK